MRDQSGDEVRRPAKWAVHSGPITWPKPIEQPKQLRIVERSDGLVDDGLTMGVGCRNSGSGRLPAGSARRGSVL
jgi:hypothetical protein